MRLLPWATISLIVYVIGFPVVATYLVWKHRDNIKADQVLRAARLAPSRQTQPELFNLRTMFHKLYYL